MKKKIELLAPAGNGTAFTAALQAGCDAIYIGLKSFSMRESLTNFTTSQAKAAAQQCHALGKKLYIAINTLVYTKEIPKLHRLLDSIAPFADAVICWDTAVIQGCKERGIPIHISTQASIANAEAAIFYKNLGAERIVLARECTLEEAKTIRRKSGLEIEVFAHGAMCVSVSGRCFLSQDTFGYSSNRGLCRQNCRRPYRVICQNSEGDFEVYPNDNLIFSAKDLCTLPFLDKLLKAGVDSLKIEGRNRPPDYVGTVISAYREAIDAWYDNALTDERKKSLVEKCRTVFNRDFSNGFFMGRPIQDFTTYENSAATIRRTLVGKITNYYQKSGIACLWLNNGTISDTEDLIIMGPTTGIINCHVDNFVYDKESRQTIVTFKCPDRVRANDAVYKLVRE